MKFRGSGDHQDDGSTVKYRGQGFVMFAWDPPRLAGAVFPATQTSPMRLQGGQKAQ